MKKKLLIIIIITILLIITFFIKINYKSTKLGNNIINQSADKIKENILNIESYNAKIAIKITSNKKTNTYEAIQKYYSDNNLYKQEIISPESVSGIILIYNGDSLKIENTKMNLSKIYENYKYIESNELSLKSFIEDFNNSTETKEYEKDDFLVLEIKIRDNNKYRKIKNLYIDKKTGLPSKMEIQDVAQNTLVYILYNEIEINKLQKDEIN